MVSLLQDLTAKLQPTVSGNKEINHSKALGSFIYRRALQFKIKKLLPMNSLENPAALKKGEMQGGAAAVIATVKGLLLENDQSVLRNITTPRWK